MSCKTRFESPRQDSLLVWRQDEVRPISCRGHDSQGGIAITLIDSLDTLLVSYPSLSIISQVRSGEFIAAPRNKGI